MLTDEDVATANAFAPFISLAVEAELAREQVADLEVALRTNRQIGAAIGIVVARRLLPSEQAFQALKEASQRLNRKLRDIALDVVETGDLPQLPHSLSH